MIKKRFIALGLLSVVLAVVLIGCKKNQSVDDTTETKKVEKSTKSEEVTEVEEFTEEIPVVSYQNNDFALVDKLYEEEQGNVVVSNTSINMALSMLLEGTNGETKNQLERYLGYSKEEAKEINKKLVDAYNNSSDENLKISIANSLWINKDAVIKEEYIALLDEYFKAEADSIDFSDSASADKINGWVSEKTNGLITQIVTADSLQDMVAVLINTVYFRDSWKDEYYDVVSGTFNGQDADMLNSTEETYFENDKAIAFSKPYNGSFEFIGILPKDEGEFSLADLDIDGLLATRTNEYDVATSMPKFKNEYSITLKEVLKKLGITDAFSSNADLTDIGDGLFVSDVLHKTYISVDETGTEAASATSILVDGMAMEEPKEVKEVILDRPYAFMIYDIENEVPLFVGKIVNVAN